MRIFHRKKIGHPSNSSEQFVAPNSAKRQVPINKLLTTFAVSLKMPKITIRRFVKVQRSAEAYYEESGWERSGKTKLKGFYRTQYGSFQGEIVLGTSLSFSIIKPPEELRNHSHWVCFSHRGGGKYFIHFSTKPKDVDSGLLQVERMINEAFQQYHTVRKDRLV